MRRYNRRLNEEDLYSFDELSDRAKENALDNWAGYVIDQDYWSYDTLGNLWEEIRNLGFEMSDDDDFDYKFRYSGIYKVTKFDNNNYITYNFKKQAWPSKYVNKLERALIDNMVSSKILADVPYYCDVVKKVCSRSRQLPEIESSSKKYELYPSFYCDPDDFADIIAKLYFSKHPDEANIKDDVYDTLENRLESDIEDIVLSEVSKIEDDLKEIFIKYANNLQDAFEYETSEDVLSDEMNNNFKFRADGTLVWL